MSPRPATLRSILASLLPALLALGLLGAPGPAPAALRLQLVADDLAPADRAASQALLDEALAALPPRLRQRLDRRLEVAWAPLPEPVYGRAEGERLLLNRRWLPALAGAAGEAPSGRTHGSQRRELLATLLHEIAHVYDNARLWSAGEGAQLARCRQLQASLGGIGLAQDCRTRSARERSLSDDPRLLDLAGWPQRAGARGAREADNGQVDRSPDPYERANPREFMAVNLEYFLLDPEYACRRPSLHRFFAEHFGWQPATARCPRELPILGAQDGEASPLRRLDPARVQAVDYLFAEANQNPMSRWGHSMLRLVVCAPGRPPGADCRLDLEHHLVLSFRAFIDDLQLSTWSGLTGDYPSRLFILPLGQVIDEYTKLELRSLTSLPLRLSREDIERLVQRAVEMHWSYDGRYYFVSGNCAVETLRLLRAGTGQAALDSLDSILPNGLLTLLDARGLADPAPLADPDQARRLGYRFDSYRDRYQAMYAVVQGRPGIDVAQVEDWLALPAARRRAGFAGADLQGAAALLLLEQAAQLRALLLARDGLKQRYLEAEGTELAAVDGHLRALVQGSGYLSRPAELLGEGYGIPQPSEWQRLAHDTDARHARLRAEAEQLDNAVRALIAPAQQAELDAIEQNLASLGERLRTLHRAGGGIDLPER